MFQLNDVIKAKRFGTPQQVIEVKEDGVVTVLLKTERDSTGALVLVVNTAAKPSLVTNETLKERGFIRYSSMRLKVGSLGSTWK